MILIDGQMIASQLIERLKRKVENFNIKAKLTIFLWKDNISGYVYANNKVKKAEYIGLKTNIIEFDNDITEDQLYNMISSEIKDPHNYIILQLPIPKGFNKSRLTNIIPPRQDIDGFVNENVARLYTNNKPYNIPATAKAIDYILKCYDIKLAGKDVVVVGRSSIVGKPVAHLMLNRDATVRIVHSKTNNIEQYTKKADILIVACGQAKKINENYVKENAIVIDVGINKVDGKIVGDVDFESVKDKVSYITPVPKGIGPMTVAVALSNIINNEMDYIDSMC